MSCYLNVLMMHFIALRHLHSHPWRRSHAKILVKVGILLVCSRAKEIKLLWAWCCSSSGQRFLWASPMSLVIYKIWSGSSRTSRKRSSRALKCCVNNVSARKQRQQSRCTEKKILMIVGRRFFCLLHNCRNVQFIDIHKGSIVCTMKKLIIQLGIELLTYP